MKKLLSKMKQNRMLMDIIALWIVAFILAIPMFRKNVDIYLDDGSQHLMRAYGTYQSIKQNGNGNIISNFVNGFGYSWNLFYGPLSSYSMMTISLIFGGFNIGFKITMCLILFLAGSLMYKFVNEMTDNRNTALLAGILYMTSPYFFTDIYVRHAIRRGNGVCIHSHGIFGIV